MNTIRKSLSVIFSFLCIGLLIACIPYTPAPRPRLRLGLR